jgi:hypothetical protein
MDDLNMDRRTVLGVSMLAGLAPLHDLIGRQSSAPVALDALAERARRRRTVFSAYPGPNALNTFLPTDYARVAAALGVRVLPVHRIFSEYSYGKAAHSPSPVVAVSYKQVHGFAAGQRSVIRAMANELHALAARPGVRFRVSLDHEVDNKVKGGVYSATAYKRAATRFTRLVRRIDAPNIRVEACYMGWSFHQSTSNVWHPRHLWMDGIFDRVALDVYYTAQYSSAAAAFDPAWHWASARNVPVDVWEAGYVTSGSQPAVTDSQAEAKTIEMIDYWKGKARKVMWFNSIKLDGDNRVTSHPAALAAYRAAVRASAPRLAV